MFYFILQIKLLRQFEEIAQDLELLKIKTSIEKKVTEYSRSLNMENGEVSVSFKDKNTRFERNLFVSRVNNTIFMQMTKSGSKQISCELKLDLHDKFYNRTPNAVAEVSKCQN